MGSSNDMYQWKIMYDNGNTSIVEAYDVVSACELAEIDYYEIICIIRID